MQGTKGKVFNPVYRLTQAVGRAIRVCARHLYIVDNDTAFHWNSENGPVLQLPPVPGLVYGTNRARDAQAKEQPAFRVVWVVGRLSSSIVAVTGGTRQSIVGRPQTVASLRAGGHSDPILVEEAIPNLEDSPDVVRQVPGRQLEGVGSDAKRRSLASEQGVVYHAQVYLVIVSTGGDCQDGDRQQENSCQRPPSLFHENEGVRGHLGLHCGHLSLR